MIAFFLLFLVPIVGLALGVAATVLLNIDQTAYSNLVINLFFLGACIGLASYLKLSRQELGLQMLPGKLKWHVSISLGVLLFYVLVYIFIVRISGFRPFSAATAWGLVTNLVVVMAEELYFRGMLFGSIQKRFSARTALIVTSLLFGLFHARQGISGIVSKLFTGWLWGSVRYTSGMIFMLIFPVHYAFNTVWLLFEGNWSNPPGWAIYSLPAIEFLLGLAIILIYNRRLEQQ